MPAVRPKNALTYFPDLQHTPWSSLSTPCLRVVWSKSPHPRTSLVSRYRVDCYRIGRSFPSDLKAGLCMSQHLFITYEASLLSSRKAGGETIPVISPFVGCAQYTPHIGYVTDSASCSPFVMIRLITLVIGVDVSHRVTDY